MIARRNIALTLALSAIGFLLLAIMPGGQIIGQGAAPLAFPALIVSIISLILLVVWILKT